MPCPRNSTIWRNRCWRWWTRLKRTSSSHSEENVVFQTLPLSRPNTQISKKILLVFHFLFIFVESKFMPLVCSYFLLEFSLSHCEKKKSKARRNAWSISCLVKLTLNKIFPDLSFDFTSFSFLEQFASRFQPLNAVLSFEKINFLSGFSTCKFWSFHQAYLV